MTKTMLPLLVTLAMLQACQTGTVDSSEMKSVIDLIAEETTAYVMADATLSPDRKTLELAPIARLNTALSAGEDASVSLIAPDVDAITKTYVQYIQADESLSTSDRTLYLTTARKLREVVRLE